MIWWVADWLWWMWADWGQVYGDHMLCDVLQKHVVAYQSGRHT
jgi:hypothetical protein